MVDFNFEFPYDTSNMEFNLPIDYKDRTPRYKIPLRYGSCGSLSLYWRGLLVSQFPLTKTKTFEYYQALGQSHFREHFEQGYSLQQQIDISKKFCEVFTNRRYQNCRVQVEDHKCFLQALFTLLKTKQIENDAFNGYLIMKPKKTTTNITV
tara:strand:+ start:200 stop:652 length:453 start_codon:yes stop_codon:yes gene_type:complete